MKKNLIQLHQDDWLDEFQEHVLKIAASNDNANVYALVDCAFAEDCYPTLKLQNRALQWRSLFDLSNNPNEKLAEVSPTLIPLHSNTSSAWRAVLSKTNGIPMISVIVTPESLDALAQRLNVWCVVDADGEHYCFRFSDTRRLPDIIDILTPEQHGQFIGPAHSWTYRNREAQWVNLNLPTTPLPPALEIHLDSDQCAYLIGASATDEIMGDLNVHEPSLIQALPPAQAHDVLCNALTHAEQGGIKGQDLFSWCRLWLRRPGLEKSPQLSTWLSEHLTGKRSYDDLTSALESHAIQH
jgi:hypothetical protein